MHLKRRSISTAITWMGVAIILTIGLLIGWTLLLVQNLTRSGAGAENTTLLVAGIVSFVFVMVVQIVFLIALIREILAGRRQSTFIDSVTHELKSPLASLRLCLETLGRPQVRAAQREQLRGMMLEDVERLSAFIDDVLEASRHAHHHAANLVADVPLAELAASCAESVRRRYKVPPEGISVDIEAGLRLVTDPGHLETVVKNLLDNAVKYSDPPIQVRLRARREAERLRIEVSDRGIGVPPSQLKRVFERFYRVESEAVRERRGTGLGLFVVKALVGSLGGRIEAHSEGKPGQGTTFQVFLPLEQPLGEPG